MASEPVADTAQDEVDAPTASGDGEQYDAHLAAFDEARRTDPRRPISGPKNGRPASAKPTRTFGWGERSRSITRTMRLNICGGCSVAAQSPEITPRFARQLERKKRRSPEIADAVIRTMDLVMNDPTNRGLNSHLLDRRLRLWDSYVSTSIRVTYERHGDTIIFRNNCRHDIIDRRQW